MLVRNIANIIENVGTQKWKSKTFVMVALLFKHHICMFFK